MRRFNGVFWLVLTSAMAVGCQQPYFMTELDYAYYNDVSSSYGYGRYDEIPEVSQLTPRDVTDPEAAEQWEVSLEEVKRIALEHNKQIAFLSYQPGEAGTQIDLQLSRFDAFFSAGGGYARTDRQVANIFQTFGTGENAFQQNLFGNTVLGGIGGSGFNPVNTTSGGATPAQLPGGESPGIGNPSLLQFAKRNAAGGYSSVEYNLSYSKQDPVTAFTALNPAWGSEVNFQIHQPLLQGAGVEVNRSPILIARANHEQSIKNFELSVQTLMRDIEQTYWQLYFTYQDLYSRETGMRQANVTWQKEKQKQEVGTGAIPDVAQAREQYEFFRAARLQALSRVLTAERALRDLMGLPPDDGRRIVPATEPTIAAFTPNYQIGVIEAMEARPDLVAQRFAVRAAELELMRQKNGLLPDLTVSANYRVTGLDDRFSRSLDRLTDTNFTDIGIGVRYQRQVGERAAHAASRQAQLALSRERHTLRNIEHTINHELWETYQEIITQYELIQVQKARREAAIQQLEAREQFYRQGRDTIDVLLEAQTRFADALRDENQAIVAYNQALINWEFVRGTILGNDNIALYEQQISVADEKLKDQRWKQWISSLPITIHKGDKVRKQFEDQPDNSLPLYPADVLTMPADQSWAPEADREMEQEEPGTPRNSQEKLRDEQPSPRLLEVPRADVGSPASGDAAIQSVGAEKDAAIDPINPVAAEKGAVASPPEFRPLPPAVSDDK